MGAVAAADQAKLAPPSLHDDFLSHFCCRFIIMASVNVENCVRVCVYVCGHLLSYFLRLSICLSGQVFLCDCDCDCSLWSGLHCKLIFNS